MSPKSSSETEQGVNVVLGMGVASMAVGLAIANVHEALEKVIPLEPFAGQQIIGLGAFATLFALLAKYHQRHRAQR